MLPWLAWAGYLLWLLAGTADFLCHRASDLPHTSGLGESAMHLLQLGLIGLGVLAALLLEIGWGVWLLLALLALAHAVAGYIDTRRAYGRREIRPFEQHVHSVLDMAPWIALGVVIAATWQTASQTGWALRPRQPALDPALWILTLAPAALLCGLPALLEFRAALAARRAPSGP